MNPYIRSYFKPHMEPKANSEAIVLVGNARFTILTSRMIRMEYDKACIFEDRATLSFWNRNLEVPKFQVRYAGNGVEIETDDLLLYYDGNEFDGKSLNIKLKDFGSSYSFGQWNKENLGGTARTLDGVNGRCDIENGLLSRYGWSVICDKLNVVLNEDSWVERRYSENDQNAQFTEDTYFFGYGDDYRSCISDFVKITGKTPMFPRYVLGNWWSRYHAYTQAELEGLMEDFVKHKIPLSVCIIDMDWHVINNPYHGGWTGYTWEKKLFPDPEGHLKFLHDKGLKTALNLHPADGVAAHEEKYSEMAEHMGLNPKEKESVTFDITDPRFADGYFRYMHHPHEDIGVDFWWMDWQQGSRTKIPGLDPLRWINHLHFCDSGRDGEKRPFIFSRYSGYGSHRNPIGFSGDTIVSWESLEFQPYFTATASNVAYGWWSHDIGGHMGGREDAELYLRWIQLGVFSPVLRIHSTKTKFADRRPWAYDEDTLKYSSESLRLRHAMIPYIYTMLYRNYIDNQPIIVPMYFDYPKEELAYHLPHQYMFGTQLLAAPFVKKMDKDIMMSRTEVWLPEGIWFDFFTAEKFDGGKIFVVYGDIGKIPVYAKAGAIVPMGPIVESGGIENPGILDISIFPGSDNSFDLYEDDGTTVNYEKGEAAITSFTQSYIGDKRMFDISSVKGDSKLIPENRSIVLRFRHTPNCPVAVNVNGNAVAYETTYCEEQETLIISGITLNPSDSLSISLSGESLDGRSRVREKLEKLLMTMPMDTDTKNKLDGFADEDDLCNFIENPKRIVRILDTATGTQVRAIMETYTGLPVMNLID